MPKVARLLAATAALAPLCGRAGNVAVFSATFDAAVPPQVQPGVAKLTPVQDFAGLGPVGAPFAGQFLRSPTGNTVTLTLDNLPPHTSLSLAMLFAAIDSLDGTGTFPEGDFFRVTLDGREVFRESFANATASQVQSYVPPAGAELARRVDLGFGGPGSYYTDSAYDFGVDPRFSGLAHTASTAVFAFVMEGPGIQPLDDESWAFDNLTVFATTTGGTAPDLGIRRDNAGMVLSWAAAPGASYRLQSKHELSDPEWTDVVPDITPTGGSGELALPADGDHRFFRLRVLP